MQKAKQNTSKTIFCWDYTPFETHTHLELCKMVGPNVLENSLWISTLASIWKNTPMWFTWYL